MNENENNEHENNVVENGHTQVENTTESPEVIEKSHKNDNPLLQRFNAMPPETFRLPSGGVLYTNGELDPEVINGEVMVYPMTTVDEISMKSPDMLFQGTAIEQVFKRCIPQVKNPMELLSNDVDFLLICLRVVTYGNTLDIYWNCPKCVEKSGEDVGDAVEEVKIDQNRGEGSPEERAGSKEFLNVRPSKTIDLSQFIRKSVPLNYNNNDKFLIKLSTGERVQLRPSTFAELLKLYQYQIDSLETPEEMTNFIVDSLLATIHSVNNHSNRDHMREWAKACEAPVIEELQQGLHVANDWGTSNESKFTCEKCSHESVVSVPINPTHFFTLPLTKKTKV